MSSIRTKDIGLFVLVVLIAASLVFAPMGYYYNIAGVINKVYAQEEGEEVVEVTTTDDEEEEPTTTTADEVVEEQPTTTTPEEQQPPITATEEEVQQPLSASFFIDSTNGDDAPATFLFETDPEGGTEPYTFSWDFGDGSPQGSGESLTHTYVDPGTYTVTLTVTDSAGQTVTDTEQVTVQPSITTEEEPTPVLPPTEPTAAEREVIDALTTGAENANITISPDDISVVSVDLGFALTEEFVNNPTEVEDGPIGVAHLLNETSGESETVVVSMTTDDGDRSITFAGLNGTERRFNWDRLFCLAMLPKAGDPLVPDWLNFIFDPCSRLIFEPQGIPSTTADEQIVGLNITELEPAVVEELNQAAESANIAISPNDFVTLPIGEGVVFAPTADLVTNATEVEDGPVGIVHIPDEIIGESETLQVNVTTDNGGDRHIVVADLNGTEVAQVSMDEANEIFDQIGIPEPEPQPGIGKFLWFLFLVIAAIICRAVDWCDVVFGG